MTDSTKADLNELARSASVWMGIGGAVFGVLSFCMLLGMWFGPMKDLPGQYEVIIVRLNDVDSKIKEGGWKMESLTSRQDAFAGQMLASAEDRQKLWDRVRAIETTAERLRATSLSREDMVEWGAALGSRNKSLSVPSLVKGRE